MRDTPSATGQGNDYPRSRQLHRGMGADFPSSGNRIPATRGTKLHADLGGRIAYWRTGPGADNRMGHKWIEQYQWWAIGLSASGIAVILIYAYFFGK